MSGITFDAGGLIALDRNDRRVIAPIAEAAVFGVRIAKPATALAQAMPNPAGTDLVALDGPEAIAAGLLLARTATVDIVDAHVAICALRAGQSVVTSDSENIRRLAPGLRLVAV